MKIQISFLLIGFLYITNAQIPNLPLPICSATAETIGDSVYFFGGASRWSGTIRYPVVYKYDGINWSFYDSIPDDNVWGIESAAVGNTVYLFAGWPSGGRYVRKYDVTDKSWSYLNLSPNVVDYGITVEYANGHIYLFSTTGSVFEYDLTNDTWQTKTANTTPGYCLSSVVYNNEIYIAGFYDSTFYKYNPMTDQWTQLADFPYQVSKCAMKILNDTIYYVGGSLQGNPLDLYNSLLGYDTGTNTWTINQFELSDKRVWMADVNYNNRFYVLGGLDTTSFAVDIVEEIFPKGSIPVELISFTAEMNENNVELKWMTSTETNNSGFEIQRLQDHKFESLKEWETIGFVPGYGTTTEPNSYSFIDDLSLTSNLTLRYRLKQIDFDGSFKYSEIVEVSIGITEKFYLEQNYPNPFNPTTKIKFTIPIVETRHASSLLMVTLKVFDILGNEVATLVNEEKPAGSYEVNFNASDLPSRQGSALTSGIYFYQLNAGSFIESKKMLLLK